MNNYENRSCRCRICGVVKRHLLAQHHEVYLIDIIRDKIDKVISGFLLLQIKNRRIYLSGHPLQLTAITDRCSVYKAVDYVIYLPHPQTMTLKKIILTPVP